MILTLNHQIRSIPFFFVYFQVVYSNVRSDKYGRVYSEHISGIFLHSRGWPWCSPRHVRGWLWSLSVLYCVKPSIRQAVEVNPTERGEWFLKWNQTDINQRMFDILDYWQNLLDYQRWKAIRVIFYNFRAQRQRSRLSQKEIYYFPWLLWWQAGSTWLEEQMANHPKSCFPPFLA